MLIFQVDGVCWRHCGSVHNQRAIADRAAGKTVLIKIRAQAEVKRAVPPRIQIKTGIFRLQMEMGMVGNIVESMIH